MAAQFFIVLSGVVSLNIRRIAAFLAEKRRVTPKKIHPRGRDIRGLSDYVRRPRPEDPGAVLGLPDPPVPI